MKVISILLPFSLLIHLQSCDNSGNISATERSAIITEIQGRLNGYADAVRKKDFNWIQNFWSDEKDFALGNDGKLETNYDSVMTKEYRDAFREIKEMTYINFNNGRALVLGKDAASYITNFDWQAIMMSGDTIKANGSWLYVFKKSGGQWKVVHSAGTHIYK